MLFVQRLHCAGLIMRCFDRELWIANVSSLSVRRITMLAVLILGWGLFHAPVFADALQSDPKPATENAPGEQKPVMAVIDSTLITAGGQIRQFAFDGQTDTLFLSETKPGPADHFTLVLDQPVGIQSMTVLVGQGTEPSPIDARMLQVSRDGKSFVPYVPGNDKSDQVAKVPQIQAIRIQPIEQLEQQLAIREIQITADHAVARFVYPVEFKIDVSEAPEMLEWTTRVARICERAYPLINTELKSDGFVPAKQISLTLKKDYDGVAFASGERIVASVAFFKKYPDDVGAIVHETAHVVQRYRHRNNPGWLVEGVADYVRYFKFEPEKTRRLDPNRAHYNGSYHTTASFLNYIANKYDKQAVLKINQHMRDGQYTDALFEKLTGKTLKELDDEWRASLTN